MNSTKKNKFLRRLQERCLRRALFPCNSPRGGRSCAADAEGAAELVPGSRSPCHGGTVGEKTFTRLGLN